MGDVFMYGDWSPRLTRLNIVKVGQSVQVEVNGVMERHVVTTESWSEEGRILCITDLAYCTWERSRRVWVGELKRSSTHGQAISNGR